MENKNLKPFFIYTNKDNLYIKHINSIPEKIYNNILFYCASVDDVNNIHICCIDKYYNLIHIYKENNKWKKKKILYLHKINKFIDCIKLYIVNNKFNVFITQNNPLKEDLYRLSLITFNSSHDTVEFYKVDDIVKNNDYIFKIDIDDEESIIKLKYNTLNKNRSLNSKSIRFNCTTNKWSSNKPIETTVRNIQSDLLEFSYSINYVK